MRAAPAVLVGRGFLFGLLVTVGLTGHASREALCQGTDCPPCGPSYCYDPAAARPLKAAKKAAAIARGLPERLAKAFDEIADCEGCVRISPDWVHILVEYDVEAMEKKFGPGQYWTTVSQAWSADTELQARNDMREGLVKSIHFILARYPCRCCPQVVAERESFTYPDDENPWMETGGWNEELSIHQGAVIDEITSPNDLGPDPPDLTNIPESAKRPPVDLEICGGPEVPPARQVHVSCEACRPIADEHDQYARWIHDTQIRLRALKRGRCILIQVINGARGELAALGRLAHTAENQAREDALERELEQRMEDYQADEGKMRTLEAEIRDMEAKRQAAIARLIACEEQCRQAPPTEAVCTGDDCPPPTDVCTGPDCPPPSCTGDECGPPAACTGDECGVPAACTGDECDVPAACTGDECGPPAACTGDECGVPAACTGDECDVPEPEEPKPGEPEPGGPEPGEPESPPILAAGLNPPFVQSEGLLPGIQDGGIEIGDGGGETTTEGPDDPRDVDPGDDPRDEGLGDDPRDEPLPENVCGPDVTAAYVEALQRIYDRAQAQLSDAEKGSWDGANFLQNNGANIDMLPRALTLDAGPDGTANYRCPRGNCEHSVTIAGHCLPRHIANDILYGVVAYLVDVPWAIAVAGAQAWDILQYGGFDPVSSKAAYAMGWEMAERMSEGQSISEADFETLIQETYVVEHGLVPRPVNLLDAVRDYEAYVLDCAPCPEPCTSDFTKDFTKTAWTLNDDRRVEYEP